MTMLFSDIEKWGDRTALHLAKGHNVSYQALVNMADEFTSKYLKRKNLIFLIGSNDIATVVAYVAAVRARQPLLVLSEEDTEKNEMLISSFKPTMVVNARTSEFDPEYEVACGDDTPQLHPDLALLLATSGTTGTPKLVKLSVDNIYENTQSIKQYLSITSEDVALLSLKMSYSFGLSILNTHLDSGAGVVLTNQSVLDEEIWGLIDEKSVTGFYGVPYTYELLERLDYDFEKIQSIRYFAQAGGKLTPRLIRKFSSKLAKIDADFYVMYGQTEASPRISYLPPNYAPEFPECIGIAIPGGQLAIIDATGLFVSESGQSGELVYKGPNVMIGYAYTGKDLAIREEIEWLKTGDIACFNEQGLFQIIGRTARFVKPFGVRTSLDSIQEVVSRLGYVCGVAGNDYRIIVALENSEGQFDRNALLELLERETRLPASIFQMFFLEKLPTLSNGKIDYKSIERLSDKPSGSRHYISAYFSYFIDEVMKNIGIKASKWENILDLFSNYFITKKVGLSSTFKSLAGDSLTYVEVSMELENYLGFLPENWQEKSIETLEDEHGFKSEV